ncbi:MAG: IclR family transcriptional regulator [Gaiellaceae bacterium]
MPVATPSKKYTELQGLGRAVALLDAIAEQPRRPKELADDLGLKWTTAYRTLAFLRESGYVRHDEATGVYSIGTRLHSIGTSYLATHPLVQAARATLRGTADETGTTVQLVERDRDHTVVLAAAEPRDQSIPKATPGFHFPLHCGSKGHVLLAFSPKDEQLAYLAGGLAPMTPESLTDPESLAERLEQVRVQGFAVTRRDVQLSTGSVAAPVRDADGDVSWCVCLVTGVNDLDAQEDALVEATLHTAQSLAVTAGWRPPTGRT